MEVVGKYHEKEVKKYVITSQSGYQLSVLNYGATIIEFLTPDKLGQFKNIIVASDDVTDYFDNAPKWGAAIGPVAGRIGNGQVTLEGVHYQLEQNLLGHHLHGASVGFSEMIFSVFECSASSITFYGEKADGLGHYPGNMKIWITYSLNETGTLTIDYRITTDKTTIVNPTNHSYFNLTGNFSETIHDHKLQMAAISLAEVDNTGLPTGNLQSTNPTLTLLRQGGYLCDIFQLDPFKKTGGIDHPFVLEDKKSSKVILSEEISGRTISVMTTSPAIVIYSSNGYDDKTFLNGEKPIVHNGIALETQILPDAIHHKGFGSIVLKGGETFRTQTIYQPGLLK